MKMMRATTIQNAALAHRTPVATKEVQVVDGKGAPMVDDKTKQPVMKTVYNDAPAGIREYNATGRLGNLTGEQRFGDSRLRGIRMADPGLRRYSWTGRKSSLLSEVPADRMAEMVLASTHPLFQGVAEAAQAAIDDNATPDDELQNQANGGIRASPSAQPTPNYAGDDMPLDQYYGTVGLSLA